MALEDEPFPRFCDDLLDVVREINRRQLGFVSDTTLELMGIDSSNVGLLRARLNEICSAEIPEGDEHSWVTCEHVCDSLIRYGGKPTWEH